MAIGYEALIAAAEKLVAQAQNDPALAARLQNNPEKAITEAAGRPLPKGIRIKVERSGDGRFSIAPELDPNFSGELEDKVLEAVSGGSKKGDDIKQRQIKFWIGRQG